MLRIVLAVGGLAAACYPLAASAQGLLEAANYDEFAAAFCAADHTGQHIFAMPVGVMTENTGVECDNGVSQFRVAEPDDDPGHYVFNIDPPEGAEAGFDCDGKADVGMSAVAINCLPANMEAMEHPKN
jgi:hypothetical protein